MDDYDTNTEVKWTYSAALSEEAWLKDILGPFFDDTWITDILQSVKAGKEATVYCCAAHPATGADLLAAKVYRPTMFRVMENDVIYREGRALIDEGGRAIRDRRSWRAVRKKSRYGRRLQITSWIQHEYETLRLLHEAGADVPQPYAHRGRAILMEYVGERGFPAPTLQGVRLPPEEVQPTFERLIHNVELMLTCGRVHADLSAYNVLYWDREVKMIDFPQAVDARDNPNAFALFRRDLDRLCKYFRRYGIPADGLSLSWDIWERHMPASGRE